MDSLFGLPMSGIMVVLVVLFGACVAVVALIYLSNRTMFRMGLRNIPRRGAQTVLVVTGLMLATLIITAAFTTGDTINYSFTKTTYDQLQRTDLRLDFGDATADGTRGYVAEGLVPQLEGRFAEDADIAGFLPLLRESVPALNPRTRLSEANVALTGIDVQRQARLGGLRLADGGRADLAGLGENKALVSEKLAGKMDIRTGDTLTVFAHDREWTLTVAGIVEDELASGVAEIATPDQATSAEQVGGLAVALPTAQRITGHDGLLNWVGVALQGDVRSAVKRSDAAEARLDAYFESAEGKTVVGLGDLTVEVEPLKQDAVESAETFSSIFTTIFLVLGLFSIAAGVMLIFMIFVMLAAERKTEMGMARAVGAKRRNLIQSFLAEGMALNVIAGAVGAALGVGAAFVLVLIGIRAAVGEEADLLTAHVTPRSLIVSYCLGAVLTFVTVVISSSRVSRLNIVAAVRGTDDVHARETKRQTHWLWVALGVPALVIPPLGIWLLLRKGFGLPNAWVWGPIGILAGAFLLLLGQGNNSLFFFSMGMSLVPLSLAGIVRYLGAPARAVWSAVGGYLAVYWLMPNELHEALFGTLDGNIEMFVLSGIMIVIGLTLLIVFNARFLTGLFTRSGDASRAYAATIGLAVAAAASAVAAALLGDRGNGVGQVLYMVAGLLVFAGVLAFAAARFPKLGPALKMGVAYPIANRFRTGMTIAMFSLIVFSIVVMSTLTANFSAIYAGDEAKGGWDVIAESSRTNPVPDLVAALNEEGSFDTTQVRVAARASSQEVSSEVRQAGREKWENYPVRAADETFFAANEAKLDMRARGYETDEAVYEAVRTTPGLAVMDAVPIPSDDFGSTGWQVKGVEAGDKAFEPFQVEMRDPVTGKAATVTVIGVFTSKLPFGLMSGIYTNQATFTPVFGEPDARTTFLRLTPGADGEAAAKGIKAALLTKGVQTLSLQERIDTDAAESKGFTRIFQLFMGLGLFVGIAALGVIAFRSVVERRQQIGMLRAIGYQRGTVALTFLFESSFIALMGILSGVVGAAILSRNLMTSDDFAGTSTTGFDFFIPWGEVVAFVAVAYVFSLLLTWWPSRGAAKVPVAEALRYE